MRCLVLTLTTTAVQAYAMAAAQDELLSVDEILVTGVRSTADPALIAPDAASLIGTPGDLNDPIRSLLALPGITFVGSDLDPPTIRGAPPDENLYLVGGIPVAQLFHELSDSIVSENVVRSLDLQPTAYDARYAGATGGVVEVSLREPRTDASTIVLNANQLKVGALIEGPIAGDIGAYASYRQSVAHLFLEEFERGDDRLVFEMPRSSDYTARVGWRVGDARLTATALGAGDETSEVPRNDSPPSLPIGEEQTRSFDAQALGIAAEAGLWSIEAVASHGVTDRRREEAIGDRLDERATSWSLRSMTSRRLGRHEASFGVNAEHREERLDLLGRVPLCDRLARRCGLAIATEQARFERDARTLEAFASDRIALTDALDATVGLNVAHAEETNEAFVEPRLDLTYAVEGWSAYVRAGLHHSPPTATGQLVLGELASRQDAVRSEQLVLGQRIDLGAWRLQTEVWAKTFEQDELVGTVLARRFEADAYGLDFLLARPLGERFHGWAALSLSDGEVGGTGSEAGFANPYALPFSATIAATYDLGGGWSVGMKYRGQSGDPYTDVQAFAVEAETGRPVPILGPPFGDRLATYHRLDVRAEKRTSYGFGDIRYYVDVLNATDRRNVSDRTFSPTVASEDGFLPVSDDDEGVPLFVAFGIDLRL